MIENFIQFLDLPLHISVKIHNYANYDSIQNKNYFKTIVMPQLLARTKTLKRSSIFNSSKMIPRSIDYNKGIFRFISTHLVKPNITWHLKVAKNFSLTVKKICYCGAVVKSYNFARHKRSKKHINYILSNPLTSIITTTS